MRGVTPLRAWEAEGECRKCDGVLGEPPEGWEAATQVCLRAAAQDARNNRSGSDEFSR